MFTFIIFVLLIFLFVKNRDLINEVKFLKTKINNNNSNISFCPKCGCDLRIYNESSSQTNNVTNNNVNENIVVNNKPKKENKLTKEEYKNSLILITGAFLIVLSALIFLATTWNSTGNLFKSIIIFSMLVIFYTVSRISLIKFNLKQTSRVFLYVSLCYLPISLFSISLFRLFGDYLSLFGTGKFIYFSLSCLLVSIIYILFYKNDKGVFLKVLIELFLYATVCFTTLIFTDDLIINGCMICIYSIVRQLLALSKKDIALSDKILFSILSGSVFMNILSNGIVLNEIQISYSLYILIYLVNLYLLFNKVFDMKNVYDYIYPVGVVLLFYFFALTDIFSFSYDWIELFVITGVVLVSIYDLIVSKHVKFSTYVIGTIVSYLLVFNSKGLLPSISFGLYLIISIVFYILNNKKFFAANSMIFNIFFFLVLLRIDYKFPAVIMMLIALFINGCALLSKKLEYNLDHSCRILGSVLLFSFIMYSYVLFEYNFQLDGVINYALLLLSFIGSALLFVSYLIDRNIFKKYLSYFSLFSFITVIFYVLDVSRCFAYGLAISTIIILTLECVIHFYNCKNDYIFSYILTVFSLLSLVSNIELVEFLFVIFIDLFLIIYSHLKKKNITGYSIAAFSLVPCVYFSDLLTYKGINFMIFIALLLITLYSYLSFKREKINIFTFISYLYLFLFFSFDISKYIGLFIMFVVSLIHYFGINDKTNNIYKFLMYTSVFIALENIYYDLGFNHITVLVIGTFIIYSIICCITLFKKATKILLYITSVIINFMAMGNYYNEIDGVFYVSLLIILLIYCYNKKIGPIFLTSLIFIVLNVLILTREFWFSIPWWIYVLGVGIVLVLFAVKNESANNSKFKSRLIDFAHYIDL